MTRILVVDDEPANIITMQAVLRSLGYEAEVARDGREALAKLSPETDLVLMDVMMPGMDGFEAVRRIRTGSVCDDVPVIMVTVLTGREDRLRAVEAGANDFVSKPVDRLELRVRIASLLKMKEARDAVKRHRDELETTVQARTAALRKSEQRYRRLFEDSLDAIYLVDAKGVFVDVNRSFLNLFGLSREEINETVFADLCVDPHEETLFLKELSDKGFVREYERKIRSKTGSVMDCVCSASLQMDDAGNHTGYQGIIHDVTERKRWEEALKSSEQRMRLVIEASPVGICMIHGGRYHYVNPAMADMFGYSSPDDIIGLPFEALLLREDHERAMAGVLDHQAGTNQSRAVDLRGVHQEGRAFSLTVWPTVIDLMDSKAVLGFVVDTSREQALREQLFQTQKMEAIGTLAGGIAHDFNNILSVIVGYLDISLADINKGSRLESYIRRIQSASERATDLVRHILTFSRRGDNEKKPTPLSPIVKETVKFIRASIPKTIEIRHDIDGNVGSVLADATQLHQVIMNLCTNAAFAMRAEGGVLSVALKSMTGDDALGEGNGADEAKRFICLTVRDTGDGMSSETLARIFEPYFTTKKPGEGTGLGLAVVHGIVTGSGGSIEVQSKVGEGTMFRLLFPAVPDSEVTREDTADSPPTGVERILFVDDEEEVAAMGEQMLSRLGYKVTALSDAVSAERLLAGDPAQFDLLITDMTMPSMTGIQLACRAMETKPGLPVILCTGYSEAVTEEQVKALGIKEFVMKPIRQGQIAAIVRRLLDERIAQEA